MSEKAQSDSPHTKARLAAEVGGNALILASVSAGAAIIWHRRRAEARIVAESDISGLIFEEPRLTEGRRELMARVATRIYFATRSSANGVITRTALTQMLHTPRHNIENVLGYLMPAGKSPRHKEAAYIDRRYGSVDGKAGYFAQRRLVELVEVGGSPTLDQAIDEFLQEAMPKGGNGMRPEGITPNIPPGQSAEAPE